MLLTFEKIITNKEELEKINRQNPELVVASLVHTLCNYVEGDNTKFYDMLKFLIGEHQSISNLMKQNISDRMLQNKKYLYIGKSYFIGATPDNEYTPSIPYQIEVKENPYTNAEEGYKRLFVKSGGADSERPITLRLAKDGNYYIWSDSFIGLLADIKKPESENPWA